MNLHKVALLVETYEQPGWMFDLVEWIAARPDFELAAILVASGDPARAGARRRGHVLLRTLMDLERRALTVRQRALLAHHDLRGPACKSPAPIVPWPNGGVAADLSALGLDLIIALDGLPVPREQLRGLARAGTWCLSYGATPSERGRHAGFWEVLYRADHTTETLWRLADRPEEDELVERRSFNTEVFWLKNQARAFDLGKLMICDALGHWAEAPPPRHADPVPRIDTDRARGQPSRWDCMTYLKRQTQLAASLAMRRVMKRNVRWRIGMFPSVRSHAVAADALVLTPPKGRFYADPFVHVHEGRPYIFFEDYDFKDRKGRIAVATYRDGRFDVLGQALDLPYHLSFPYVFEYGRETYMVPESCANRSIELWKCVEFPLKWELSATLMANVSAVDTIIFKHGEYWWLFTNIDRTDGQSHCDELFAFYAPSPVSGAWMPHAANPIVRSPAKARNAGVVVSPSGEVIRCAQYQGFCQYGKGVSLNRIEKLTPTEYEEADGVVHYAQFIRKNHASMHHWHSRGGPTVFDFAYMD
ncbi:hypothetical protein GCM10023144_18330 [Pigmentiphaga soli]|uniref:Glucosamine inositolphosphorylceramide transferase 1 N-terminal domain-containing protein n=1 Tax=Pigmentiphaga soli TaxID=1007095 RepID=A0ABP8GVR2_9BURK